MGLISLPAFLPPTGRSVEHLPFIYPQLLSLTDWWLLECLTSQHNNKGIKNAKHMSRKKLSDDHFLMTSFGSLSAKKQKVYRWAELRGSSKFFMFISFLFYFFLRCDDECCPTLEKTRDSAHLKAQY